MSEPSRRLQLQAFVGLTQSFSPNLYVALLEAPISLGPKVILPPSRADYELLGLEGNILQESRVIACLRLRSVSEAVVIEILPAAVYKDVDHGCRMQPWEDEWDGCLEREPSSISDTANASSGGSASDTEATEASGSGKHSRLCAKMRIFEDSLGRVSTVEHAWRIRAWAIYGNTSLTRQSHSLEDSSSWTPAKPIAKERHVEALVRLLYSLNDSLPIPHSPVMQEHDRGNDHTAGKRSAGTTAGNEGEARGKKRPRLSPSNNKGVGREDGCNEDDQDERDADDGDDGDYGDPTGDPEPLRQGVKCPICHNPNYPDSDSLLQHLVDAHLGNCCPICEERIVDLGGGRYGLKDGTIENIFFKDKLMKPHVLRVHLRPYKCLVPSCDKRFDSRGLKKHLGFGGKNPRSPHIKDDIEAAMKLASAPPGLRTWGDSGSNLGYPQLSALVSDFKGSKSKEQMKGYLYRRGEKLYDCDDPTGLVDRLFLAAPVYGDQRLPEVHMPGGWECELPQQGGGHGFSSGIDQPQGTGLPNTSNGENPSYTPTDFLDSQSPKGTYGPVGSVEPSAPLGPYDPPLQVLPGFGPTSARVYAPASSLYSSNTYNSYEPTSDFFSSLPLSSQSTSPPRLEAPISEENNQGRTIEQATRSRVYGQTSQFTQLPVGAQQQPSSSGATTAWQLGYNIAQTFHLTDPEGWRGVMQYIADKGLLDRPAPLA